MTRSRLDRRALALALVVGLAGGALFNHFRLPLAWMIGAMVATTAVAVAGVPVAVPKALRGAMIMVLGIMLGSTFNPALLDHAAAWGTTLGGLGIYIVVATAVGVLYLRRVARLDPVTAWFTASPGGLNEMILIGGAMGGDERTISLTHSLRILLVVMTVPFWFQLVEGYQPAARGPLGPPLSALSAADAGLLLACVAGVLPARWLRLPMPVLIGPMLLSAGLHLGGLTASKPPGVVVATAQVVVGAAIGCRFVGASLRQLGRTAVIGLGLTALMLGVTVAAAIFLNHVTGIGLPALILAFAPGGLAEMSLVALALGVDAAFVSTHHIVRILLVIALMPLAFRLWRRWGAGRT